MGVDVEPVDRLVGLFWLAAVGVGLPPVAIAPEPHAARKKRQQTIQYKRIFDRICFIVI